MAFSFMHISKIKTVGNMVSKYNHNYREVEIDNVIPELSHLNDDLIPLPTKEDGSRMRYDEAFDKRISELPYYQSHKVRKDQVLGYEVLLSFSRDEGIDIEKWKEQSVDWLHQTFDVAGDGKSNVLSAVFHGDESGNVHIHAFVVPVDERGRLNAKRFTGVSHMISELHTSYAEAVSDLGLERGLAGSSAKHKVIRKMYADLNNAINIPDPKEGETAAEYKKRIQDEAETLFAVRKKAADDRAISTQRKADAYAVMQREAAADEMDRIRNLYTADIDSLKKEKEKTKREVDAAKEELSSYQAEVDSLTQQLWEIKTTMKITEEEREGAVKAAKIQVGIELIRSEEPERADRLEDDIDYAIAKAEARAALEEQQKLEAQEHQDTL